MSTRIKKGLIRRICGLTLLVFFVKLSFGDVFLALLQDSHILYLKLFMFFVDFSLAGQNRRFQECTTCVLTNNSIVNIVSILLYDFRYWYLWYIYESLMLRCVTRFKEFRYRCTLRSIWMTVLVYSNTSVLLIAIQSNENVFC